MKTPVFALCFLMASVAYAQEPTSVEHGKILNQFRKITQESAKKTKEAHESLIGHVNQIHETLKDKNNPLPDIAPVFEEGKTDLDAFQTWLDEVKLAESAINQEPKLKESAEFLTVYLNDAQTLVKLDLEMLGILKQDIGIRQQYADTLQYSEKGEVMAPNAEVYAQFMEMQKTYVRVRKQQIKTVHGLRVDVRKIDLALKESYQEMVKMIQGA